MTLLWLIDQPLQRVKGEGQRANLALQEYARQTPGQRSLRRLLDSFRQRATNNTPTEPPPTVSFQTVDSWSRKNDWQARVARFDALEAARIAALRAEAERSEIAKWAARRQEIREREWSQAQALTERVGTMLKVPVVRQETADGKTIIMPARWSWGDVPRMAEIASKLARLAADMPTSRESILFEELSDTDLAERLAGALSATISPDPGSPAPGPGSGSDQAPSPSPSAGSGDVPPVA